MEYKYFSADCHWDPLWLPKDLWQERLPAHLREIGPNVVETDAGTKWTWEGELKFNAADGRDNAKYRQLLIDRGVPAPEGSLPPTDPTLLLAFMDQNKICATVFFSKPANWVIRDRGLHLAMYRAYNDWVLEVNAVAPERLIGLPTLPTTYPEECAAEVERLARKGVQTVEFGHLHAGAPVYDPCWEPVWQALEDADMLFCCHAGPRAGFTVPPADRNLNVAYFGAQPMEAATPLGQLVMSAVFERHPRLRLFWAESRVGWVPFFMHWLDKQVHHRAMDLTMKLSMAPSDYLKRNVVMTFEDDVVAIHMLADAWEEISGMTIWGSDYPHPQGLWGTGFEENMEALFARVPADIRRQVLLERAAELFRVRIPTAA